MWLVRSQPLEVHLSDSVWILPLHSRFAEPVHKITHLEVPITVDLERQVSLARAWFDVCPDPSLHVQSFTVELTLLEQRDINLTGVPTYPAKLEASGQVAVYSLLHISRDGVWFEACTREDDVLESPVVPFDNVPVVDFVVKSADIEPRSEAEPGQGHRDLVSQITLALEIKIEHAAAFDDQAYDELLRNLDFALEQQRNGDCLAPESSNAVTRDFCFRILDTHLLEAR
jgi:hypothetical protein